MRRDKTYKVCANHASKRTIRLPFYDRVIYVLYSFLGHAPPAQHWLGPQLGLESRGRLLREPSHLRDPCHPLRERRE